MKRQERTPGEKRDIERVARAERRVEYVTDELVNNVTGADAAVHGSLKRETHDNNIAYFRTALETAMGITQMIWLADGAAPELREPGPVG